MIQPIDNIMWVEVDTLTGNDYNPNFVLAPEMVLLKTSLLKQGWIQPILIRKGGIIIDGFHRSFLAKNDEDVRRMTNGKVPCAVLDITDAEAKLLTVRINRAKGVHSAVKMHELVSELYHQDRLTIKQICEGIGATADEVDLLLKEGVFKKLDIENHKFSEAWTIRPNDK